MPSVDICEYIDKGVKYAEKFFGDMYRNLPEERREYMFGELILT